MGQLKGGIHAPPDWQSEHHQCHYLVPSFDFQLVLHLRELIITEAH